MKTFRVEVERITSQRAFLVLEAKSKKEALAFARTTDLANFDESEVINQVTHRAKRDWNFFDLFLGSW